MKNNELDHIDRQILDMLQENARASLKDIAEKVYLSSPAVSARIETLVESGYIEGFRIISARTHNFKHLRKAVI